MHIVIDCRFAFPHLSGIGRYAVGLVTGLRELDPALRLTALVPQGGRLPLDAGIGQVEALGSPRSPSQQVVLPRLLRRLGADLFHSPDAFSPVAAPCPTVITIHDLIPLMHRSADRVGLKEKLGPVWEAWLGWQCDHAAAVLTVSEFSRADILRLLPVDPAKLHVVYPGIALPKAPAPPRPGNYILYVGRRDPNKNVPAIVRALALVRDTTLNLVVVGHADPRFPEAEREAERLGLSHRVTFAGHLSDAELDAAYRGAKALLLVSFYEGFGYPPLEAMARGVPAIVSPVTSLPETAGTAALYADPCSDADIARAINRVTDLGDSGRSDLIAAGLAQAQRFTLQNQAQKTVALYRDLIG